MKFYDELYEEYLTSDKCKDHGSCSYSDGNFDHLLAGVTLAIGRILFRLINEDNNYQFHILVGAGLPIEGDTDKRISFSIMKGELE